MIGCSPKGVSHLPATLPRSLKIHTKNVLLFVKQAANLTAKDSKKLFFKNSLLSTQTLRLG